MLSSSEAVKKHLARLTKLTHLHYNQFFLSIFFSTSGSLSSLESFGHVDDLDLSKLQLLEAVKTTPLSAQ